MGYTYAAFRSVQDIVDELNERNIPLDEAEVVFQDGYYGEIEVMVEWEDR